MSGEKEEGGAVVCGLGFEWNAGEGGGSSVCVEATTLLWPRRGIPSAEGTVRVCVCVSRRQQSSPASHISQCVCVCVLCPSVHFDFDRAEPPV